MPLRLTHLMPCRIGCPPRQSIPCFHCTPCSLSFYMALSWRYVCGELPWVGAALPHGPASVTTGGPAHIGKTSKQGASSRTAAKAGELLATSAFFPLLPQLSPSLPISYNWVCTLPWVQCGPCSLATAVYKSPSCCGLAVPCCVRVSGNAAAEAAVPWPQVHLASPAGSWWLLEGGAGYTGASTSWTNLGRDQRLPSTAATPYELCSSLPSSFLPSFLPSFPPSFQLAQATTWIWTAGYRRLA